MILPRIPQVVFFDAAGTLFHVKGSVGEVYLEYARKYGVNVSAGTIQQAFVKAFADAPPPVFAVTDPQAIKACERLWWFDVVHNVFYRIGMFEGFDEYFDEVFQYFAQPEAWTLYSETLSVLETLEAREVELGIVSNFDSRLYDILIGLGIDRFFGSVTLSSFAGAAKPSPKIFERALRRHAATAVEALHVGDSITEDAQAATSAGMTGVWLNRVGGALASNGQITVRGLEELLTIMPAR